jgi:tryptophan synthase alpha chain
VPVEEAGPAREALRGVGIALILLVAPTSTRARVKAVRKLASGFVYFVSHTGVTGARETLADELEQQVRYVRKLTGRPVVVGFGIADPEQVRRVARFADGVVVGSALVERIAALGYQPSLAAEIEELAHSFALATRRR